LNKHLTSWPIYCIIIDEDKKRFLFINPKRENIMCRLRVFYECSDGTMGWAEMVVSYDEDIKAHIKHLSQGVRMVTTEYVEV